MEQFVFLLVVGAIALVKWLLEKSAELREKNRTEERLDELDRTQPPPPPMVAPRPTAFPMPNAEEAARRLRKALGLPEEYDLPPIRAPKPVAPPEPAFRVEEEVEGMPMADLEQRTFASPPPLTPEPLPFRPTVRPPEVTTSAPRSRFGELLRSRDGIRTAVLAQEILGTPKGLVF